MLTPGSTLTYFKQLVKPGEGDAEPSSITAALYVNGVLDAASVTITGTVGAKTFTVTVPAGCVRGDRLSIKAAIVWDAAGPTFTEEVYTDHVDTSTAMIGTDGKVLISADAQDLSASLTVALNAAGRSAIATAVWSALTSALTVTGSIGKLIVDRWTALTATRIGYLDNLSGTSGITVTSRVNGTAIAIQRGDTNTLAITGLGLLTGRTKLYFTAKSSKSDADAASIIQIEETGGLLYLNGATTTTTNGTLVVDDATAGNVTITLKAAAAAALSPAQYVVWDIEMVSASAVPTLVEGTGSVTGDVTRAVA